MIVALRPGPAGGSVFTRLFLLRLSLWPVPALSAVYPFGISAVVMLPRYVKIECQTLVCM